MKTILCLYLFLYPTLSVMAQRYVADPQQSKLIWTGHAEVGSYAPTGTIKLLQGAIKLRNGQLSNGRVEVDMRTIQHENGQMQSHLRGADFFDATTFPTASFTVHRIRNGQAQGKLTIRGITKWIAFPMGVTRLANGVRLQGQLSIDRTAFGVKYNSNSFFSGLGDYAIRDSFELAFDVVFRQDDAVAER